MEDIVKIISQFVGNNNLYKRNVSNCLVKLIETAQTFRVDKMRRKEKHMAAGIELAVKMISYAINEPSWMMFM